MKQPQLELIFKDSAGKTRKITVKQPRAQLSAITAEEVMQTIAQADIFTTDEGVQLYHIPVGARYVSRDVDVVYESPLA